MGGEHQTFQKVAQSVDDWIPKRAYRTEKKFQNDLQQYLDERLNSSGGGGFLGGFGEGSGETYVVSKERGNANADVVVNDVVGIELKRDLTNSQTKKLRGQIEAYRDNYPYVIACTCGVKDVDGWRELQSKYDQQGGMGMGGGLGGQRGQVTFIWKRKENFGNSSGEGPGGGGFGSGGGGLFGL